MSSYHDLVRTFAEVLESQTLGYYQGDLIFFVKLKESGNYSIFTCSYGSCSYCDRLESIFADNYGDEEALTAELNQLTAELKHDAERNQFETVAECVNWAADRDWEVLAVGSYIKEPEWKSFCEKVNARLANSLV